MTDLIEEFYRWYRGPEGKVRWIATAESVEGFLARAFMAGDARRAAEQAALAVSPEGLRELENEQFQSRDKVQFRPGVARSAQFTPDTLPAPLPIDWPRLPRDGQQPRLAAGPPPVTDIRYYTPTNTPEAFRATGYVAGGPFEGAQDRQMELREHPEAPGSTFTWPGPAPTGPLPVVPREENTDGTS